MKIQKVSTSIADKILASMIVDDGVCAAISAKWDAKGLFGDPWRNLMGKWIVQHHDKHGHAPGKSIEVYLSAWSERAKNPDSVKAAKALLKSLEGRYKAASKEVNRPLMIDIAGEYFRKIQFKKFADSLYYDIEKDDLANAEKSYSEFRKIELGVGAGIDIMRDKDAMIRSLESRQKPLFKYKHPNGLGKFYGNELTRDAFIVFMGSNKRGKSWQLLDMAWESMLNGLKVAFFQAGDLTENQIMTRFMTRAAKHPVFPCEFEYPLSITVGEGGREADTDVEVSSKTKTFDKPLDWRQAYKAYKELIKKSKRSETLIRLSAHPQYSLTIGDIKSTIKTWHKQEGWEPDVIVLDSADILKPSLHYKDERGSTNYNYSSLRGISQENHCMLVSASQANAKSFANPWVLTRQHFSEDNRKLAHVTSCVGLNQTNAEKEQNIIRLNWVVMREEHFVETRCCFIASALKLANPNVRSIFP